jgi:cell division protein FtsQ
LRQSPTAPTGRPDARRPHVAAAPAATAKAHRRRGLRRLAVVAAAVLALLGFGYLLLVSPVLGASSVEVTGTALTTPDGVRAAAAIPPGHPLLRLDTDAVAERVRALPPVLTVSVQRSWPTGVVITVTERTPLAFVTATGGAGLVDSTGSVFATVPVPPPGLPKLDATEPEATGAAAAVLAVLAEPHRHGLWAELVEIRAEHPADLQLVMRGNRTVRWGSVEASARKADVLAALLTQPGNVYDVASPELPTIR